MNFKEVLIKFKNNILKSQIDCNSSFDLENKIEDFLIWYNDNYPDNLKYNEINDLINKWTLWYETKYPDHYFNDNINDQSAIDTHTFITSLNSKEKNIIDRYKYPRYVRFHFHIFQLTKKGIIEDIIDDDNYFSKKKINYIPKKEFIGLPIKEVYKIFKNKHIVDDYSEILKVITFDTKQKNLKERFLDAVMYQIIDHGKEIYGPRRALLFAKEFGRNIDIPMIYGINSDDNEVRKLINDYFELGGRSNLECIDNYFDSKLNETKYNFISIDDYLNNKDKRLLLTKN